MSPTGKRGFLERMMARFGGVCVYCGIKVFLRKDLAAGSPKRFLATIDHMVPKWLPASQRPRNNLTLACLGCNNDKGPLSAKTYLELRTGPAKVLKAEKRRASMEAEKLRSRRLRLAGALITLPQSK